MNMNAFIIVLYGKKIKDLNNPVFFVVFFMVKIQILVRTPRTNNENKLLKIVKFDKFVSY